MTPGRKDIAGTAAAPEADLLEVARRHARAVLARTEGDAETREKEALFQALVAEIATGFIGASGDELETALGPALERIAKFAGAERAVLVRVDAGTGLLSVVADWSTDLPPGLLRSVHGKRGMPWALVQLRRGITLHYTDREQLPPEATRERKGWDLFALRSLLALPVRSHSGELLGLAAFATVTRPATWRSEELGLFDLAAEMLRSAFEQQALRSSLEHAELRLRRLLESGALGILSADSEGRIWEANDAALQVLGSSRKALEAGRLRWDAITPPEYRPMTMGALDQLERSGCSDPWEQDVYRADGSRVSILVCLARIAETPASFLIYAVDITADKKAERELALRTRLSRLVTLFSTRLIAVPPSRIGETIDEALRETGQVLGIDRCTVWIDVDGSENIARCAHAWDRSGPITGLDRIPPLDRSRFPTWNEDFRQRRAMLVRDVTRDYAAGDLERKFLEANGVRSGVAVPLIGSRFPMGFATFASERVVEWPEAVVSLLCVIGEIFAAAIVRGRTEEMQHRVHAELEKTIAERTVQLETANHELEAFSYAVSHDLRAPLRSVDGFSRILVEDHAEGLPPDAKSILDRIRATSQRMGDLIDSLLRLSRIIRAEPQFERTDLSAIARDLAASLAAGEPARSVEFRIEDDLVVEGEPRLLTAVLDNLLRNAWKFTAPRSRATIEFGSEREGDARVYYVRDDGVGFEPSQAERIFTPFQRLHDPREFEGHGVGLATVKRIVGVHGGRVWSFGEPDRGATIRFTLRERR